MTISRLFGGSRLSECRNGFADGSSGSEWSSPSRDPPWEARGKRPMFSPGPVAGNPGELGYFRGTARRAELHA